MMQSSEQKNISSTQEMLLREYQSLIPQITHWDSHFWTKSQFFMVIESAFLAIILQGIKNQITPQNKPSSLLFYIFFFIGAFNIYLCYVWFRTNRRNREYLILRFERAIQIEAELGGMLRTFTTDLEKLPKGHGSATWEIHLATGFIIVWLTLMVAAIIWILY
jgi:hypothetical protein